MFLALILMLSQPSHATEMNRRSFLLCASSAALLSHVKTPMTVLYDFHDFHGLRPEDFDSLDIKIGDFSDVPVYNHWLDGPRLPISPEAAREIEHWLSSATRYLQRMPAAPTSSKKLAELAHQTCLKLEAPAESCDQELVPTEPKLVD